MSVIMSMQVTLVLPSGLDAPALPRLHWPVFLALFLGAEGLEGGSSNNAPFRARRKSAAIEMA